MIRTKQIERLAVGVMEWTNNIKPCPASCWEDHRHSDEWLDGWDPFEQIKDAMQVAEKIGGLILTDLRQDRWNGPPIKVPDDWGAQLGDDDVDGYGKTPQEAICLAALRWLDVKDLPLNSNKRQEEE